MSKHPDSRRVSRRDFVRYSAASASALAAGGLLASCDEKPVPFDPLFAKGGRKPKPTNRNPLKIPPTESADGYVLNAMPASVNLGGDHWSNAWTYNVDPQTNEGFLPGPTLEARRDGWANLTLYNHLPDETITHWHGMIIDQPNDGHPQYAFRAGEDPKRYSFKIVQRACLNWYHPHPHGRTGEQVNLGLAGAFIIRDDEEPDVLPAGPPYEVPLIIRDAKFDKSGNLRFQTKRSGFEGDTPLVNGTVNPTLAVEPAVYRFRVLNGANGRNFRFALDQGVPFHLIGNDGGLLEEVVTVTDGIDTSPAERLDLLVDFRTLGGGTVMLKDLRTGWDLLEFVVSNGDPGADILPLLPSRLSEIEKLVLPAGGVTREFAFEGMSRINGREFEMLRPDVDVPFGTVERWIFTTKGNAPHPVHVHASPFQVQRRTGGRGGPAPFPWETGWKDSVLLEDGETVEVLVRFDNPVLTKEALYLMHCHKLSHEDAGMMLNFRLV